MLRRITQTSTRPIITFRHNMASHAAAKSNPYDKVITNIAEYVHNKTSFNEVATKTAHLALIDTLGCGFHALTHPGCAKLLGPVVEGTTVPNGARVPGTNFVLDPIRAAWNFGVMVRYNDFNDTFLGAEWGHPSDNLGGILPVLDFIARQNKAKGQSAPKVKDVLNAIIQAYEIQGVIAIENAFNRRGLDHVILVKLGTAAVVSRLLGFSLEQTKDVVSHVFVDGSPLRTYRHFPNTGSRKSWAAGDATSRGVQLAYTVGRGEMGYPSVLTTPTWGYYDNVFKSELDIRQDYDSYIMENILFKISFPAEFHAQSAVECALTAAKLLKDQGKSFEDIEKIVIKTQQAAIRIIDKKGPLTNYADRDHCIQYMTAIPLIYNRAIVATDYDDSIAENPAIDALREKMVCEEVESYTADYHDPEKRSIANALKITLKDGTTLEEIQVDYPVGHKRRRDEGIPLLYNKFALHLSQIFSKERADEIYKLCVENPDKLHELDVDSFVDLLVMK